MPEQPKDDISDVTIIGAGPTGLFAAFCAGMRQMRTKIIEMLPEPGGQLAVLYPDKYIYDAPGHAKIKARDLVRELVAQSGTFGQPVMCLEEQVKRIARADGHLVVETDKGQHPTRTVVVSAGIGAFRPKRLQAEGLDEAKEGVDYFVRDFERLRGRDVLIIGGGDSAADWALSLKDVARSLTLIHRSDRFRAHEASMQELFASPVRVLPFHELKRVHGDQRVEGVTIFDNRTGEEEQLAVDDVIVAVGFEADLGGLRDTGVEMDAQRRHIVVNPRMETNMPGVYAAGDVTELTYLEKAELPERQRVYEGSELSFPSVKYEERKERWGLIVMGYAQAAVAVNQAKHYLDPASKLMPGHSSEMDITPAAQPH